MFINQLIDVTTGDKIKKVIETASKSLLDTVYSDAMLNDGPATDDMVHDNDSSGSDDESGYQDDAGTRTEPHGISRLRGIHPFLSTCDHPLHMSTATFNHVTIGVCISAANGRKEVVVGELSGKGWAPKVRLQTVQDPKSSIVFVDQDRLFIMISDASRADGVDLHVLNKMYQTKSDHVTPAHFPTAIRIWKPSSDSSTYHLAISHSPDPYHSRSSFRNQTVFYRWTGTYFDEYTKVDSFRVHDICPFSSGGKDYVVIVNHESAPGIFSVDSEVFKFDIDNKQWITIQKIPTTGEE